jgi:hypothetical protein
VYTSLQAAPCDDGDACTTDGTCKFGLCETKPISCDDGDACTADACDATLGCQHTQVDGACNDGDVCTKNDVCVSGLCKGTPKDCEDGDPCTEDSCNPQTAVCKHKPSAAGTPCDAKSACVDNAVCGPAGCTGVKKVCDDGNPCTVDLCNNQLGCIATPSPDGTACGTDLTCQAGSCQ